MLANQLGSNSLPHRENHDSRRIEGIFPNSFEVLAEQKLETAINLIRKTIEFVKSEYEMDLIILTSYAPNASRVFPFAVAGDSGSGLQPSAGYHSSSGIAADFLHTPAGRHVITCWHQFCQGNALYQSASSSLSLKSSVNDQESPSVSFNIPITAVRPTSVSPSSSNDSCDTLDSNENMILSSNAPPNSTRKRPKNFLVNSLMTATSQMSKRRRASLSQSDSLKSSEAASPITNVLECDQSASHEAPLDNNGTFEPQVTSSDAQVLDLSTNNTPTSPPPEFDNPSDAFGLLAAIKEEENMPSPDKLKRAREQALIDSRGSLDSIRLPKSGVDELLATSRASLNDSTSSSESRTSTPRTRDELKNFIRAHGPIKKRSASLTSDSDFYRRSSLGVPSSLAEDIECDRPESEPRESSLKQSPSAGTLMSSSSSTNDSDSLWSCPKCSKVMKKKCSYRHVKEVHGTNREVVQCPVCYRSFTRKYTLVLHCRNVHPHLDVSNATEFPTKPVGDKFQEKDDADSNDAFASSLDLSSASRSRNTSTPGELDQSSVTVREPPKVGRPPKSTQYLKSLQNDHILRSSSTSHGQQLVSENSLSSGQSGLSTSQSSLLSQHLLGQSLLNPHFNSLELSLRLAQLERSQQRQLELLSGSSESNGQMVDSSTES